MNTEFSQTVWKDYWKGGGSGSGRSYINKADMPPDVLQRYRLRETIAQAVTKLDHSSLTEAQSYQMVQELLDFSQHLLNGLKSGRY